MSWAWSHLDPCFQLFSVLHVCVSCSAVSDSYDLTDCSPLVSSVHGIFQAVNTGVGCHSLLQEIFPNQRSNLGLLHCRQILCRLSHQGSLRILEWVAYPFSRRFLQPRNRTRVSYIAGGFFTREAPSAPWIPSNISSISNFWFLIICTQKFPQIPKFCLF